MQRISIAACALAVASAFSAPAIAAPTVTFKTPTSGATVSGYINGASECSVTGSNIRRVQFYVGTTYIGSDSNAGFTCRFESTKFKDGAHQLKAVAYDSSNRTATATINITIKNGSGSVTPPPPPPPPPAENTPPSVSITAPTAGAQWTGYVNSAMCAATATDADGIEKVEFSLDGKVLKSDLTVPYQCSFESATFLDGTYPLVVKATDKKGGVATVQRDVVLKNGNTGTPPPPPPPPTGGTIDAGDILTTSLSDTPFAQQSGYNGQVLGTFPSVQSIPEAGIHGSVMANGESLRMGKEVDPANPARKAIAFALAPNDPMTSGSKRSEFKYPDNIDFGSTYWAAFRLFVPDWGTLPSSDMAVFGTQLHTSASGSEACLPGFSMTALDQGRRFRIHARGNTSAKTDLVFLPIPFGRWADFVFKFRQSTGSDGLLQVWMDGQQIATYTGPLGCKTANNDYIKFGYYNYSTFNTPRKLLMRQIILVKDPTGSKYAPETLRAFAVQ